MSDDQSTRQKTPAERQAIVHRKAKELAQNAGKDWKALSKEERRDLKVQVRDRMKARRAERRDQA
jgi:hypothetical protein